MFSPFFSSSALFFRFLLPLSSSALFFRSLLPLSFSALFFRSLLPALQFNNLIVEQSKTTSRLRRTIIRNMRRHLLPKYGGHVKVQDLLTHPSLVHWVRRYPYAFQQAAAKTLLVST